jgi:hypothetical protein
MDPFKKYIQENREAVDADAPRPIVWERIEKELPAPARRISINRVIIWSAAACVVVLAGVGLWSLLDERPETGVKDTSMVNGQSSVGKKTIDNGQLTVKISRFARNNKPSAIKPKTLSPTPQTLNPIAGLESSFIQVINLQKARISTTPMYAESAAYFNDFKVEMRQMEKDEAQIKKDISTKGMTNELLDQLINIYQQKLNMLKQLQLEMQKTNNRYKQNRVSVDTVRTYFLSI